MSRDTRRASVEVLLLCEEFRRGRPCGFGRLAKRSKRLRSPSEISGTSVKGHTTSVRAWSAFLGLLPTARLSNLHSRGLFCAADQSGSKTRIFVDGGTRLVSLPPLGEDRGDFFFGNSRIQ